MDSSKIQESQAMAEKMPEVYAVKHKNEKIRALSRSGGVFTALSDSVLAEHGVVYGCILTDNFEAVHIRATTDALRDAMRGSKYIQSSMGTIFADVKKDLDSETKVLFSGTSCQIAGLKSYLNRDYENLICVDIVCHGVPSPLVWKEYLEWQAKKNKGVIQSVDFRNKKQFGWAAHVESLFFQDGRRIDSKVFTTLFYSHVILRPCCYKCPYKDIMHPGNITIADYWGIDKASPGFNDNKGVSLVLINDAKGKTLFEEVKQSLDYRKTEIECSLQPPLVAPFSAPKEREGFWKDKNKYSFNKIAKKYAGYGLKNRIIRKSKSYLIRIGKKLKRQVSR